MKIYKVKVNGKVYEVELESVSEAQGSIAVAQQAAPQAPANLHFRTQRQTPSLLQLSRMAHGHL